jgi:hypothetical protein
LGVAHVRPEGWPPAASPPENTRGTERPLAPERRVHPTLRSPSVSKSARDPPRRARVPGLRSMLAVPCCSAFPTRTRSTAAALRKMSRLRSLFVTGPALLSTALLASILTLHSSWSSKAVAGTLTLGRQAFLRAGLHAHGTGRLLCFGAFPIEVRIRDGIALDVCPPIFQQSWLIQGVPRTHEHLRIMGVASNSVWAESFFIPHTLNLLHYIGAISASNCEKRLLSCLFQYPIKCASHPGPRIHILTGVAWCKGRDRNQRVPDLVSMLDAELSS